MQNYCYYRLLLPLSMDKKPLNAINDYDRECCLQSRKNTAKGPRYRGVAGIKWGMIKITRLRRGLSFRNPPVNGDAEESCGAEG